MDFPFRSVLVPINFDEGAGPALAFARQITESSRATLHLLHVLSTIAVPGEPKSDISRQIEDARKALQQLAALHLDGLPYQVLIRSGDVVKSIVEAAQADNADLILMPTHGRRGIPRWVLGSVAERVVRNAACPVLTFRPDAAGGDISVSDVMSRNPPTVSPLATLEEAHSVMTRHDLMAIPVVEDATLIGIVTDRDLRLYSGRLDAIRVSTAMTSSPVTVAPGLGVNEAARLLIKLKVGSLPVVDNGKLVGMITTDSVIKHLLDEPAHS
jgi:CBS domain-containing protein/nucleotide-binding universal stress UspA family protein